METFCTLLWFHTGHFEPCPSGLLHWYWGNYICQAYLPRLPWISRVTWQLWPGSCPEGYGQIGNMKSLTPNVRGTEFSRFQLGRYHGCWCPGSLRHQDISSHNIDYVEYAGPCLTWGRISTTCVISMCRNDIKCKYLFMFPWQSLPRKGLIADLTTKKFKTKRERERD